MSYATSARQEDRGNSRSRTWWTGTRRRFGQKDVDAFVAFYDPAFETSKVVLKR